MSFTREFMKYCWDGIILTLTMPETQTQSPRVLINLLSMKQHWFSFAGTNITNHALPICHQKLDSVGESLDMRNSFHELWLWNIATVIPGCITYCCPVIVPGCLYRVWACVSYIENTLLSYKTESEWTEVWVCAVLSRVQHCDPMDCSPPGSSICGIFQARILEWIAISYCRRSSQPRDRTLISCFSCTGTQVLYHCTTWKAGNLRGHAFW